MKLHIQWEKDFYMKYFKRRESAYDGADTKKTLSEHYALHCEPLGRVKRVLRNGQITEDDVHDIRQTFYSLFMDEFVCSFSFFLVIFGF